MIVPFQVGEEIHLVNKKGRTYRLTLKAGATFLFSGEAITHDDMIGQEDGSEIAFSRGTRFFIFRPTLADYTLHMPRGAQILYPKDLALIPMWADIYPGATVIEAGMGSGALSLCLLNAIGEKGKLFGYEIREDFASRALKNIESRFSPTPLGDRLFIHQHDIYTGIKEESVDRIVLDLPEPHQVVPHAIEKLRAGGIFLAFLPTVPQVEILVAALQNARIFERIETFETLLRPWNIDGRSVRPSLRMVGHSGFITTARRVKRLRRTVDENTPSDAALPE